jgi:hypothetical protein
MAVWVRFQPSTAIKQTENCGKAQQQDKFLLCFTGPSGCVWAYQQLGITEETNFTKMPKIENFPPCFMSTALVMYCNLQKNMPYK